MKVISLLGVLVAMAKGELSVIIAMVPDVIIVLGAPVREGRTATPVMEVEVLSVALAMEQDEQFALTAMGEVMMHGITNVHGVGDVVIQIVHHVQAEALMNVLAVADEDIKIVRGAGERDIRSVITAMVKDISTVRSVMVMGK